MSSSVCVPQPGHRAAPSENAPPGARPWLLSTPHALVLHLRAWADGPSGPQSHDGALVIPRRAVVDQRPTPQGLRDAALAFAQAWRQRHGLQRPLRRVAIWLDGCRRPLETGASTSGLRLAAWQAP